MFVLTAIAVAASVYATYLLVEILIVSMNERRRWKQQRKFFDRTSKQVEPFLFDQDRD